MKLEDQGWKRAHVAGASFPPLSTPVILIGKAKLAAVVLSVILVSSTVIVLSTSGGCKDQEPAEWCEERQKIGMCTSESMLELTEMKWNCEKTCELCGDLKNHNLTKLLEVSNKLNSASEVPPSGTAESSDGLENGKCEDTAVCTCEGIKEYTLKSHNEYRKLHWSTPPMRWDDTLQRYASNQCAELVKNGNDKVYYRESKGNSGQNIAAWYSSGKDTCGKIGASAIGNWYNAIRQYKWDDTNRFKMENLEGTETFIQMVWSFSAKLGCAYCKDEDRNKGGRGLEDDKQWTYIVCNYSPCIGSDHLGTVYKLNWGVHFLKGRG